MRTLLARGYLERRADATLRLGAGVGTLLRSYQRGFNINDKLAGIVGDLAGATAETSFLSTLDDRNVILKVLVEGSQPLRVSGRYVGLTGNEPHRASGKAVLAHADAALRDEIIERNATGTSPTAQRRFRTALLQELKEVRKRAGPSTSTPAPASRRSGPRSSSTTVRSSAPSASWHRPRVSAKPGTNWSEWCSTPRAGPRTSFA